MSSLALHNVVKHYRTEGDTIRAVDCVSLTVPPGQFAALYGPSGSGKTTLLLMAAGLLRPDYGSVYFGDRDVGKLSDQEGSAYRRNDVGIVFQSFRLMAGATALSNVAVKLLGDKITPREARRRAEPWLDRVGLAERHDHKPRQLSMGERQRVAIARALVNDPRLLLADEPTGSLDSERSRQVLSLLQSICHEQKIPGLLVTHDPLALAFVDRTYTLKDGKLHDGVVAEVAVQ